jgi:DNA-binding Lrp family transcriptional regulator
MLLFCENKMISLDTKDKMIIYYLIQNSRQSLKTIGKNIDVSKEFISYRIKRLIDNDIIKNFSILINYERLGYSLIQTHYKFININPNIKEEIIDFLVKNNHTVYVSQIEGSYDLQVDFYMGKPQEFEDILDELRRKYQPFLIFKVLNLNIGAEIYNHSFLVANNIKKEQLVKWIWGQNKIKIDELDFRILEELSKNAKIQIKKMAQNLGSTVTTIKKRIQRMENDHIIAKYTINVDWPKIGYRLYNLQISLSDFNKKNQIIEFISKHPNLIRRMNFLNLDMDLHFKLLLENMQQLRSIIEEISSNFPDSIHDYQFYSTYKIFKNNPMIPDILKEKNPIN